MKFLFNKRKSKKLMKQITHLNTLLEVSEGYLQHDEYSKERDKKLAELRKLMVTDVTNGQF